MKKICINPPGIKTYLNKDKEALIIFNSESEGYCSVGVTRYHIFKHLNCNIEWLNPQKANKSTKNNSISRYTRYFIQSMNKF